MDDNGDRVTGQVDRVTIEDGAATLHIGDKTVSLKNVVEILARGERRECQMSQ